MKNLKKISNLKKAISLLLTLMSVISLITAAFPMSAAALSDNNGKTYTEIVDLNVSTAIQNQNWSCSGASTKCVLDYFGISHGKTAENLSVSYLYQLVNNLNAYGLSYKYQTIYNKTDWQNTVIESVLKGNPVVLLIKITDRTYWPYTSDGHYVVVSGIYKSSGGELYALCNDSWAYVYSNKTAYYNTSSKKVLVPLSTLFAYNQAHPCPGYVITSDVVRDQNRYDRIKSMMAYENSRRSVKQIYTTTSQITVRNAPISSATGVYTFAKNTKLVVIYSGNNHYGNTWYYVTDGSHSGYLYCSYVRKLSISTPLIKCLSKSRATTVRLTLGANPTGTYTVKATCGGTTKYYTVKSNYTLLYLPKSGTWTISVRDSITVAGVTQNSSWSATKTVRV